jgi:hypothetical protein
MEKLFWNVDNADINNIYDHSLDLSIKLIWNNVLNKIEEIIINKKYFDLIHLLPLNYIDI